MRQGTFEGLSWTRLRARTSEWPRLPTQPSPVAGSTSARELSPGCGQIQMCVSECVCLWTVGMNVSVSVVCFCVWACVSVCTCVCAIGNRGVGPGLYYRLTICPHFLGSSFVPDITGRREGRGGEVPGHGLSHRKITLRANVTPAKEQPPQGHIPTGPHGL